MSCIKGCICLLILLNSTSPILDVPATVLTPSGAKNIKSPAISCILCPSKHPTLSVTGTTAILFESLIFINFWILFLPNINNSLRKLFNPTTASSKVILPAVAAEKFVTSLVPLKKIVFLLELSPATTKCLSWIVPIEGDIVPLTVISCALKVLVVNSPVPSILKKKGLFAPSVIKTSP